MPFLTPTLLFYPGLGPAVEWTGLSTPQAEFLSIYNKISIKSFLGMYAGYINIFDLGKLKITKKNKKNLDQPLALNKTVVNHLMLRYFTKNNCRDVYV